MVGRVWPRHLHRGRPLNSVVSEPGMNRRAFNLVLVAIMVGTTQPAFGLSLRRPARADDALGIWLGYTIDGELYRIDLRPEGEGSIAVTSASETGASLYRIETWTLTPQWQLTVVGRGLGDFRGENVFVEGHLGSTPSKLTIGDRKQWHRELMLLNEKQLLEQSRRTRERAESERPR